MGFLSDHVRMFPSASKNIVNIKFYGVYRRLQWVLYFLNRKKKMQCMRKSSEVMLMNAPWSRKFTLPPFLSSLSPLSLFKMGFGDLWIKTQWEVHWIVLCHQGRGPSAKSGTEECMYVCGGVCIGKHMLRKHLWGGWKHWSGQWGFHYEFVCGEITRELFAGSLSQGGLALLEYKELSLFLAFHIILDMSVSVCVVELKMNCFSCIS